MFSSNSIRVKTKLLVITSAIMLSNSELCNAQFVEAFAVGQQMKGDKTTYGEKELKVADSFLFGAGAGFNLENFNMHIALLFGSTEITMEDKVLNTQLFGFEANAEWAFLSGGLSPLLGAGIGSINFTDSFVAFENLNETNFSYNIYGGAKWIIQEHYLVKALYKATWTQIKDTESSIQLDGFVFNLGYVF